MDRKRVNELVRDANPVHERMIWVRKSLKLKIIQISQATKIPYATYCCWEGGMRTSNYENLLTLVIFLETKWRQRYERRDYFPYYNGDQVERITIEWLLFGRNITINFMQGKYDEFLEDMMVKHIDWKIREEQLLRKIEDLNTKKNETS